MVALGLFFERKKMKIKKCPACGAKVDTDYAETCVACHKNYEESRKELRERPVKSEATPKKASRRAATKPEAAVKDENRFRRETALHMCLRLGGLYLLPAIFDGGYKIYTCDSYSESLRVLGEIRSLPGCIIYERFAFPYFQRNEESLVRAEQALEACKKCLEEVPSVPSPEVPFEEIIHRALEAQKKGKECERGHQQWFDTLIEPYLSGMADSPPCG